MSEFAVDPSVLAELLRTFDGDQSFVDEVIDAYLGDAPQLVAEIVRCVGTGDVDGFRRAAHSLKSTSATVGALRLSAICRDLEFAAKESAGLIDDAPLEGLAREIEDVARTLRG